MALSNVALTDTFDVWRTRTNQIVSLLNGTDSNVIRFQSNTTVLNVTPGIVPRGGIAYLTLAISTDTSDTSTSNITSASVANTNREVARLAFAQANLGIGAVTTANGILSVTFGQANTAYNQANAAYAKANSAGLPLTVDAINTNRYLVFANNTTGTLTQANVTTALTFNPSSNNLLIGNGSKIGMGTPTPSYPITVSMPGQVTYLYQYDGSGTMVTGTNGSGLGVSGTFSATDFAMFSNSTEKMRIDTLGKVGIGTSSPAANLHVKGIDTYTSLLLSGVTKGVRFFSTTAAFNIEGVDYTGSATYQPLYVGGANVTITISDIPKVHISSSGFLGVNTVTPSANLHVVGNTYITAALGVGTPASDVTGEIRAANNVTAYYSSDSRLKENVISITNSLEKVKKIRGVEFDWIDNYIEQHGGEDGYFVRKHDVGVIAQELEAVLPEVVATRQDGMKAVKYDRIVALLIEAIKELEEKVSNLEAK